MMALMFDRAPRQFVWDDAKAYARAGRVGFHAVGRARELQISGLVFRKEVPANPTFNDGKRTVCESVFVRGTRLNAGHVTPIKKHAREVRAISSPRGIGEGEYKHGGKDRGSKHGGSIA